MQAGYPEVLVFAVLLDGSGVVRAVETCWPGEPAMAEAGGTLGRPIWEAPWWVSNPQSENAAKRAIEQSTLGGEACIEGLCRLPGNATAPLRIRFQSVPGHPLVHVLGAMPVQAEDEQKRSASCRLLYGVCHDLQEPLRMIHLYSQLIQQRHGESLEPRVHQLLDTVIRSARRLSDLVASVLSYASLDRPGSQLAADGAEPVNASWALDQALQNLRALVEDSGAEIEAGPLPIVLAHRTDLPQLFQNLVANAINYRKPGVSPRIVVGARRTGEYWEFSIADNGIGFSRDEASAIFEAFTQLRSGTGGMGLGLAICRRLAARMGGTIWAESEPGVGSTFRFTARAAPPVATAG